MTGLLTPGMTLHHRYDIMRLLGQGGMGAVYLAEDNRLRGRLCAIKENLPDPNASPHELTQVREQFKKEARVLARLDHPNLPKVSDFFSESGREYLVMDYVEGEDLESAQQRVGGPLPEKPVLLWTQQVLEALDCLHHQQPSPIIHRDIKPANIRLTPQGKVKLVDFGLVKLLDLSNPRTKTIQRGLGTPEYAPLEQYASGRDHTDGRSDIYSLGATMYHLLTNVAPPDVHQRLMNPALLVPPRQLNPQISANTERVVLRSMEIHANQRYQNAKEMKQELAGQAVPSAPPLHTYNTGPTVQVNPPPVPPPLPFDIREVAKWSAIGALIGTVLGYLPKFALSASSGPLLDSALYAGMLFFGAIGAVIGVLIARETNLDAPDFLPKVGATFIITLVLAGTSRFLLGSMLLELGFGVPATLLGLMGSVGGGVAGIRLAESDMFRQVISG